MKSVVLCVWGRVAQDWLQSSTEEQDQLNCVVYMGKGCHVESLTRLVSFPQRNKMKSVVLCVFGRVAQDWLQSLQSSTEEQGQVSCMHGGRLHLDSLTRLLHSLLVAQRNKIR